jgi:1-deoxy-D-xylulose-5-phosphate synthase
MWDASILPVVPGLRLACPRDPARLRALLREAVHGDGPAVIRYPKAAADADIPALQRIGHCDILRADAGARVLLLPVGSLAAPCLRAARELATTHGVPVTVADPRWTAPVDPALLTLAAAHELTLTVEDNVTTGALGARLAQALATAGSPARAATFALPDQFLPHASRDQLLNACGLDADGITTTVLKRLTRTRAEETRP